MFTLKVFDTDGSYRAIACKTFRVTPPKAGQKTQVQYWLDDGTDGWFIVDPRVIVENLNGKTIDVIRPYGKGDNNA